MIGGQKKIAAKFHTRRAVLEFCFQTYFQGKILEKSQQFELNCSGEKFKMRHGPFCTFPSITEPFLSKFDEIFLEHKETIMYRYGALILTFLVHFRGGKLEMRVASERNQKLAGLFTVTWWTLRKGQLLS